MVRLISLLIGVFGLVFFASQASASNCEFEEYDHNNSLMEVQICDGDISITYLQPKASLKKSNVFSGTLLFDGTISGIGAVSGVARRFSGRCGVAEYNVTGAIRPNSILLTGVAPSRNSSCRVTKHVTDELLFTRKVAAGNRPRTPGPRNPGPRNPGPRPTNNDWYAIAGSFNDFGSASFRVSELPGGWAVKDTNDCQNMRGGLWIAAIGPFSQQDAEAWARTAPRNFQAYSKSCN